MLHHYSRLFKNIGPKEKIDKKDYKTFFFGAVFGVAINMLLFIKGLEYTTPIHASVIMITVPIIVLVLSAIYLKERITTLKIIGVVLGFSRSFGFKHLRPRQSRWRKYFIRKSIYFHKCCVLQYLYNHY
ncbi:DMT family transporter [Lacinutrix neustonica]|uniref:DMT family transporter n=1 Tax=Lacinutrix neustonica TaxID=2980107 RepID=A0A9E8SC33_9FLAO|nr:DMT family transporter [Lacinutrix neustonica]WAC00873.1 DMT family transporter [Lacinutrix neustonica]